MKKTIDDLEIRIFEDVYDPAEDSFLLAENISISNHDKILELGSGTGYVSIYLAKKFPIAEYFTSDINSTATKCTKLNAFYNTVDLHIVNCDLFSSFIRIKPYFDVILFNSPYLPVNEKSDLAKAWSGGGGGLEIIRLFISNLPLFLKPNGRCYLVVSSYTNIQGMISLINDINYSFDLIDSVIEGREKILLYLLKSK
ncbi:MAG TPA: HemK2/MTQ2 family protein methyltransferase [Candidatus Bathyarchaeia archaeon]|nr:HemK2/MTQ2 family protein methyltransferase [Candidatus Bathyarchaeia archaeon]